MSYLEIEGHPVKMGNFWFVSEITGNRELGNTLFKMETYYYTNLEEFAAKMRNAIELLAKHEYLREFPQDTADFKNKMTDRMYADPCPDTQDLKSAVKIYLISRSYGHPNLFHTAYAEILTTNYIRTHSSECLRRLVTEMYKFASEYHHSDPSAVQVDSRYALTQENCRRYMRAFFYFVRDYLTIPPRTGSRPGNINCGALSFNESLIPLGNHVPLTDADLSTLHIRALRDKRYYICQTDDGIEFRLACTVEEQKRETDVLQNIWRKNNRISKDCMITLKETVTVSDSKKVLIFSLPSKPMDLKFLQPTLTAEEKEILFYDAVSSIRALHKNKPVYYHRDVTDQAFVVCNSTSGYWLILTAYDCVKDTGNAQYTVWKEVDLNRKRSAKEAYVAPEILALSTQEDWDSANWEMADIYALGILGVFLFTGTTDPAALENAEDVPQNLRQQILQMCAPIETRCVPAQF